MKKEKNFTSSKKRICQHISLADMWEIEAIEAKFAYENDKALKEQQNEENEIRAKYERWYFPKKKRYYNH